MKRTRSSSDSPISASNLLSGEQRINKLLAAAGLGSRRQVDELIEQGRVEIDGVICDQLGMKVDADTAKITVDGTALKKFRPVYFALHKPSGVLCTNRDPQGRRRAIDFIPGHQRLFPVGRLDAASTGLLLLTNDGELTQQLTHPKHGVPKTYYVVVAGQMEPDELRRLRRGVYLSDGVARVDNVKIRNVRKNSTELEITLSEGKNREIRRVLARVGHKVVTLRRISIGPLKLGNIPEAAYRPLAKDEIAELYRAAEDARKARKLRKKESASRSREKTVTKAGQDKNTSTDQPKDRVSKVKRQGPSVDSAVQKQPASPRDPFAWDDDDELLKASPFDNNQRFDSADESDEEEDEWDDEIGVDESQDDEPRISDGMEGESLLVDGRAGMRVGKVLDYDESDSSKPNSSSGPRQKSNVRVNRRPSKKSGQREPRSSDHTRGGKKSPRATKKKFSSAKSTKKGGFKKGGFKSREFNKGSAKKGGLKRGGRASKAASPKSSGRSKRRQ